MYIYKYCVSNESFQQTVNSNPIVRYIVRAICKKRLDSSSIETEIKKIKLLDRKNLLTTKTTQKAQVLPLTVTYNRRLPNIKQTIQNHWPISKTNKVLEKNVSVEPIIAFRKNKSLKQLIEGSTIQNDKNIKKSSNKYEGKCTPCISGIRSLCFLQVQNIHSFRSQKNGRIFTVFIKVSIKN